MNSDLKFNLNDKNLHLFFLLIFLIWIILMIVIIGNRLNYSRVYFNEFNCLIFRVKAGLNQFNIKILVGITYYLTLLSKQALLIIFLYFLFKEKKNFFFLFILMIYAININFILLFFIDIIIHLIFFILFHTYLLLLNFLL
jgi:hypothetical protein